jgi:hypothetical protein
VSGFVGGIALCPKATLFLLQQLVEFDKKGLEFLRVLFSSNLCCLLHQSFSLFALQRQLRFGTNIYHKG